MQAKCDKCKDVSESLFSQTDTKNSIQCITWLSISHCKKTHTQFSWTAIPTEEQCPYRAVSLSNVPLYIECLVYIYQSQYFFRTFLTG